MDSGSSVAKGGLPAKGGLLYTICWLRDIRTVLYNNLRRLRDETLNGEVQRVMTASVKKKDKGTKKRENSARGTRRRKYHRWASKVVGRKTSKGLWQP
jgi:hypothetical protein